LQAQVVDFVIEATDMPKRHMLADRIRAAVGIQNPEQQQAAMEAQQQAAAIQQDMAQKAFVLDSALKAAQIRKTNAEAEKVQTESTRAKYEPIVRTPKVDVQAPAIQTQ
jgi:FKBP-type peptidyl-prolyl cis-trans isomerase